MVRSDIDALWSLADKCVNGDIVFVPHRSVPNVFSFERLEILNSMMDGVYMNGHFNCSVPCVTFNITIEGVGAVSRYCVGGPKHGNVGRFHQHSVRREDDIRKQLPYAVRRDELRGLRAKRVWEVICSEANIVHVGTFFEPEEMCR